MGSGKKKANGKNWVHGGIDENPYLFALIVCAPFLTLLLSFLTSEEMKETGMKPHLSVMRRREGR